jgi:hypothetical protein
MGSLETELSKQSNVHAPEPNADHRASQRLRGVALLPPGVTLLE